MKYLWELNAKVDNFSKQIKDKSEINNINTDTNTDINTDINTDTEIEALRKDFELLKIIFHDLDVMLFTFNFNLTIDKDKSMIVTMHSLTCYINNLLEIIKKITTLKTTSKSKELVIDIAYILFRCFNCKLLVLKPHNEFIDKSVIEKEIDIHNKFIGIITSFIGIDSECEYANELNKIIENYINYRPVQISKD